MGLPHVFANNARGGRSGERSEQVAPIRINEAISIDEREIEERFIRASGPGGQNVNKLASAVQLRFDVRGTPNLPDEVRERLERLAGRRLTREGVLVISAQRHRTQERNRADARERRLQSKKRRGAVKNLRQGKPELE